MKRYIIAFLTAAIGITVYSMVSSEPSRYEGKIVKKIEFTGLKNVSPDELLYEMRTSEGYPLKSSEVRKDIKEVFEKGKFEKVEVEIEEFQDGVRLRFVCRERPLVESVVYKGLAEMNETELQDAILVKEGDVFRKDLVEKSLEGIRKKYETKGLFNAIVTYNIKPVKDKENVKVEFVIDEGEEIKVKKITILGADRIYSKEITGLMETAEDGIFKDGNFNRETYEQDKAKILAFYKQNGYQDAQIIDDRVEYEWENPVKKEKRGIFITISVNEGEKYYFDKYSVHINSQNGKAVFKPEDISRDFLQKESGAVFDNTRFEQDRQMINMKYGSEGYIFTRVVPKKTVAEREVMADGVREKRRFISVDFVITEGSQAYIESIIIKGNKKTKDKVIRREIACKEGELFDSRKIQISREKVYNLGYFKQVNIDVRPGSREGYMNLVIDVEEQPSATISVGGGYGTTSGFSIFADVTENNFRGEGETLGVKLEYGPQRASITLSFTEPWVLDNYPLAFSTSVFYNLYKIQTSSLFSTSSHTRTTYYQKQGVGYSMGLSYRFWYYYSVGMSWIHEFKRYLNPEGDNRDEIFLAVDKGWQEKRTVRNSIFRDSKNNYLNPTSGTRVGMAVSLTGGALGGNNHYIKWAPEASLYWSPFHIPFLKDWNCVFEFRGSGTFLTKPLGDTGQDYSRNQWIPDEDRLLLGGPETLRGWDYYDSKLPESWRTDGLFDRVLYGVEFRVPIHPQMLWMVFFFDAGSLWSDSYWVKQLDEDSEARIAIEDDKSNNKVYDVSQMFDREVDLMTYFKYGYGVGFRIQIPMMPLRFWFGRKMIYDGDRFETLDGYNFQFQIGDYRY